MAAGGGSMRRRLGEEDQKCQEVAFNTGTQGGLH